MSSPTHGHASLLGATFAGYRVVGLVGRGAMGAVYLAHDISLNRPVALKVLLGSLAKNPAMVDSFKHEARAAAPLRHPNIVRIYNAGIVNGTPFLAMEYVEGEPLDRFLRRKGLVAWPTALFIGEQVADALACAHQAGVIHRDVKPANIMLDAAGKARLTDFGIANMSQAGESPDTPTAFVGTPHYMSPEQCSGRALAPSSDLFSLGVLLYRMISGSLPFDAESPLELIKKINTLDPPRLNKLVPDVPDDVARAVAHLMSKRPEQRPENAADAAESLRRLQAEKGGRSALPTALAAFIAEQAEIRPIRGLSAKENARTLSEMRGNRPTWGGWFRRHRAAVAIVAAGCAGAVAASAGVMALRPQTATFAASPVSTFTASPRESRVVPLASDAYTVRALLPAGGSRFTAILDGRAGSVMTGSQGILGIDPSAGRVTSLRLPTTALLDGGTMADAPARFGVVAISPRLNRGESQPVLVPALGPQAAPDKIRIVAQPFTDGSGGDAAGTVNSVMDSEGRPMLYLALHPDGNHYAAVERAYPSSPLSIVEHSRLQPRGATTVLAAPSLPLIPESIQYAGNGDAILYQTLGERDQVEQWIEYRDGHQQILGRRLLHPFAAVSPDTGKVALTIKDEETGQGKLVTVDAASGAVLREFGGGIAGTTCWYRDDALVLSAFDEETGANQIWELHTATGRRERLTTVDGGIAGVPAISADGEWIAAALAKSPARAVLVATPGASL